MQFFLYVNCNCIECCDCNEYTFRPRILTVSRTLWFWLVASIILIFACILGQMSLGRTLTISAFSIVFLDDIFDSLWWFLGHGIQIVPLCTARVRPFRAPAHGYGRVENPLRSHLVEQQLIVVSFKSNTVTWHLPLWCQGVSTNLEKQMCRRIAYKFKMLFKLITYKCTSDLLRNIKTKLMTCSKSVRYVKRSVLSLKMDVHLHIW